MDDSTNYSKPEMERLQEDIKNKKMAYNECVNNLTNDIHNMHNYWVEGDAGAEAVYQQLLSQYNQFKQDLEEGFDLMTEFENQVGEQEARYAGAENKISTSAQNM